VETPVELKSDPRLSVYVLAPEGDGRVVPDLGVKNSPFSGNDALGPALWGELHCTNDIWEAFDPSNVALEELVVISIE
jgi:hypothetical protein